MAVIRFSCAATGRVVETKLKSEDDTLNLFRDPGLRTKCCFCTGHHHWRLVHHQWMESDWAVEFAPKVNSQYLC